MFVVRRHDPFANMPFHMNNATRCIRFESDCMAHCNFLNVIDCQRLSGLLVGSNDAIIAYLKHLVVVVPRLVVSVTNLVVRVKSCR